MVEDNESSRSLIEKVRQGDMAARDRLVVRYLPTFRRWAHGRLPRRARHLGDTDDLLQISLIRALEHINGFVPRREGAFLAYLRTILMNVIRDEIDRVERRPQQEPISDGFPDAAPSALDNLIGKETLAAYEAALAQLSKKQREAFVMRVEMGLPYREVAANLGNTNWEAARSLVVRSVVQMAKRMQEGESRR